MVWIFKIVMRPVIISYRISHCNVLVQHNSIRYSRLTMYYDFDGYFIKTVRQKLHRNLHNWHTVKIFIFLSKYSSKFLMDQLFVKTIRQKLYRDPWHIVKIFVFPSKFLTGQLSVKIRMEFCSFKLWNIPIHKSELNPSVAK